MSEYIGQSASRPVSPRSRAARSQVAVRHGIGWLFAAALVPGIVAASLLFYEIYRTERQQLEQGALQTARALSTGLERDLAAMRGKLEILATTSALQAGDLKTFYDQALCRRLLGFPGDWFCGYILSFGYPANAEALTRPLR